MAAITERKVRIVTPETATDDDGIPLLVDAMRRVGINVPIVRYPNSPVVRIDKRHLTEEQWRQLRRFGIGSSDAASASGLSRYQTPYQLWREKTGLDEPADLRKNPYVYWGKMHEATVARHFAQEHPEWSVRNTNFMFWREDLGFPMFANFDRLGQRRGERPALIEIKTGGMDLHKNQGNWGEPGTAEIPDEHYVQVLQQFALAGERYQTAYVPALLGGNDYREYVVQRDNEAIQNLIDLEKDFWQKVVSMREPEIQTLDDAMLRWPTTRGEAVEASPEIAAVFSKYKRFKGAGGAVEENLDGLKVQLAAFMEDADTLTIGGKPVLTHKLRQKEIIDGKGLREEMPDVAARFTKKSSYFEFRLK